MSLINTIKNLKDELKDLKNQNQKLVSNLDSLSQAKKQIEDELSLMSLKIFNHTHQILHLQNLHSNHHHHHHHHHQIENHPIHHSFNYSSRPSSINSNLSQPTSSINSIYFDHHHHPHPTANTTINYHHSNDLHSDNIQSSKKNLTLTTNLSDSSLSTSSPPLSPNSSENRAKLKPLLLSNALSPVLSRSDSFIPNYHQIFHSHSINSINQYNSSFINKPLSLNTKLQRSFSITPIQNKLSHRSSSSSTSLILTCSNSHFKRGSGQEFQKHSSTTSSTTNLGRSRSISYIKSNKLDLIHNLNLVSQSNQKPLQEKNLPSSSSPSADSSNLQIHQQNLNQNIKSIQLDSKSQSLNLDQSLEKSNESTSSSEDDKEVDLDLLMASIVDCAESLGMEDELDSIFGTENSISFSSLSFQHQPKD